MKGSITIKKTGQKIAVGDYVRAITVYETPTGWWQEYCEGKVSRTEGTYAVIEKCEFYQRNSCGYLGIATEPHFGEFRIYTDSENLLLFNITKDHIYSYMDTKNMNTIKSTIKNLLRTEPEKSFVKAGFMDELEEITTKGLDALHYVLWESNKEKLKEIADKINEEKLEN